MQYFNPTYRRRGTPGEGRYRATVAVSQQYLVTRLRHNELNPVRAGLVAHPKDYPWLRYQRHV